MEQKSTHEAALVWPAKTIGLTTIGGGILLYPAGIFCGFMMLSINQYRMGQTAKSLSHASIATVLTTLYLLIPQITEVDFDTLGMFIAKMVVLFCITAYLHKVTKKELAAYKKTQSIELNNVAGTLATVAGAIILITIINYGTRVVKTLINEPLRTTSTEIVYTGHTISGSATPIGNVDVANRWIQVCQLDNSTFFDRYDCIVPQADGATQTDQFGDFTFSNLEDGKYLVFYESGNSSQTELFITQWQGQKISVGRSYLTWTSELWIDTDHITDAPLDRPQNNYFYRVCEEYTLMYKTSPFYVAHNVAQAQSGRGLTNNRDLRCRDFSPEIIEVESDRTSHIEFEIPEMISDQE